MSYDGKTENGIPYMTALYTKSFTYQTCIESLDKLKNQRDAVLSGNGVQTYTIGNRSITRNNLSAGDILKQWDKLMAQKLRLETNSKPRKAVGVVHRDW